MGGLPSLQNKDDDIPMGVWVVKDDDEEKDSFMGVEPFLPRFQNFDKNVISDYSKTPKFTSFTERIHENENYGKMPLYVIENVMMFLELQELHSMTQTCKLFYHVGSTQKFWKSYSLNWMKKMRFKVDESCLKPLDWKIFFRRKVLFTDSYYRQKYRKFLKEEDVEDEIRCVSGKIVTLGTPNTGRTSFVRRFVYEEPCLEVGKETTIGAAFLIQHLIYEAKDGEKSLFRAEIWDVAAQERYHYFNFEKMYCRGSQAALVFFGIDSLSQFEKAKEKVKMFREYVEEKYYYQIILVGSKCDLEEEKREVFYEEHIKEFLLENMKDLVYVELSSKSGENVYKAMGIAIDGVLASHKKRMYEKM